MNRWTDSRWRLATLMTSGWSWVCGWTVLLAGAVSVSGVQAQEQIDRLERQKQAAAALARITLRVRVADVMPESREVVVEWRRGGEGLGGSVVRGRFRSVESGAPEKSAPTDPSGKKTLAVGEWSAWTPAETVCGRAKSWEFPSITVSFPARGSRPLDPPSTVTVDLEFAEDGHVFRQWSEAAPRGATVGIAFPAGWLDERGARNPEFVQALQGLSGHARARRERLERDLAAPAEPLQHFGVIGHLAGYGQGPGSGLGKATGFGVRHNHPEIVADECRTLQLLGVNGLVDEKSLRLVQLAGQAERFRRIYWGGPGSGSPMAGVSTSTAGEPDGCPWDPRLVTLMDETVTRAIAQHGASGAQERWALWWDEIGVAAKAHVNDCPRCAERFRDYLRGHQIRPQDVDAAAWEQVVPFPLWSVSRGTKGVTQSLAPPPADAAGRLRYYYTYRFMSHATGQLFPAAAQRLQQAGIRLYAMQGPTPSWNGSSLDWHEFYDTGANTALVFETSNRDPRAWPWESYLADIMRGIAQRHGGLPQGCLVKPHRGAPQQRMLSVVARGTRVIEWYTYGPDYAKGDSFSQSPELLAEVGRAGRFLARAEPWLANATWTHEPAVALVFPRSSEIWGRAGSLGITPLEDAKWVYLALRHAHVPVNILSEQQLAEGVPDSVKVLYVVGPHLRRDATARVAEWVRAGGILWTDALGLSRDEADQPNEIGQTLVQAGERQLISWGQTPEYRATRLEPLRETQVPEAARLQLHAIDQVAPPPGDSAARRAYVAREILAADGATVLAEFADQRPAATERVVGRGRVFTVGLWCGLSYSATVRRADFDMQTDFDPGLRWLMVAAADRGQVIRPAVASHPQVEVVSLQNDRGRCVALINWSHQADRTAPSGERPQPVENLTIEFSPDQTVTRVRSLQTGEHLPVRQQRVVLPALQAIDVLVLE